MTSAPELLVARGRDGVGTPGERAAQPTVVILCPNAWSVRNIVHAGTAERVRSHGVRVHVLTPSGHAGSAEPRFDGEPWTRFHDLPRTARVRGKALLDELLRASFNRRYGLRSYRIFDAWNHRHDRPLARARRAVLHAIAGIARYEPFFGWQRRLEEHALRRGRDLHPIIRQLATIAPHLVVSTSCVSGAEWPYLLAARDLGIPTLGCILSFDNLTSRGMLPTFDAYAVWNERMRSEVLRLYPDRNAARIYITGSPQFDFHHDAAYRWGRERTLRFLGVEPHERYVVYAANSAALTPSEPKLVEAFARRCAAEPALARHRIVVRPHPLDDFTRWESLECTHDAVRISRPWRHDTGTDDPDDQAQLVSTLLHADVCINIASTMSLDAAAVDTPVVCVAFAVSNDPAEHRLVRGFYETDHYRPIAESGGVRVARDMEALMTAVRDYAAEPARDRDARARLFETEGGWRGTSGTERLAASIARLARHGAAADVLTSLG